ncbi:hypothetical protein EJJ20_15040 [Pseudomonas poae]|nr:hypothetical protein EJJ20_15040 [Pseudomonas poae]
MMSKTAPDYLNPPRKALWSIATLITLSVYAALIAWWLHTPVVAVAEAAPAAMMIELAAAPVAQAVEEDLQVAPDKVVQKQLNAPSVKPAKALPKRSCPQPDRAPPSKPPHHSRIRPKAPTLPRPTTPPNLRARHKRQPNRPPLRHHRTAQARHTGR